MQARTSIVKSLLQRACGSQSQTQHLYATHEPTSVFQKGLITVGSSLIAFMNPERGDMVAALGETTGIFALQEMRREMLASASGQRLLQERPRLTQTMKNDYLSLLPTDTLGHAYYKYMSDHGFKVQERTPVRFVDDEQLAYVMMRYREIHDFFHVLSGLPPTVLGELAVKAFEFTQLKLPMALLSSVELIRLSHSERMIYWNQLLPWAVRCGKSSKYLMSFEFEKSLEMPLDQVRSDLLFQKAPSIPSS